jgi:predicted GNAT family N-acyltransferase
MEVKQIDAKDTLELRSQILRNNKEPSECYFEHDNDDLTFHLGAFVDDKLASVASFYMEKHADLDEEYQYRLRGMATLPEFRGQGLSSALLRTAFPIIKNNNVHSVWCNARKSAVGFYEKVGFETIGDEFNIADIGPHLLMIKNIAQ